MIKKITYLLPLLLLSSIARAQYGLDQLGKALISFSVILVAIPFIVGGISIFFVKERKIRAFFIGFGISAAILIIWIFSTSE